MLSALAIVFISIFGFLFCICACCTAAVCFCCAAVPKLYSTLAKREYCRSDNVPRAASRGAFYEPAPDSDTSEIALAEAYFAAPLAAAVVVPDSDGGVYLAREQGLSQSITTDNVTTTTPSTDLKFKDAWAALLFLAQVTVIVWLAVRASFSYMKVSESKEVNSSGLGIVATAAAILGAVATALGSLGLTVLLRYSDAIIEGVMWVNIVFFAIAGVVTLILGGGAIFLGLLLLLSALVNYWYLYSVRDRIAFASEVLSVACQALRDHFNGIIAAAYSMLVLQLSWFFLWSVACFGVYQTFSINDNNNPGGGSTGSSAGSGSGGDLSGQQIGIIFSMFLSLYWGSEVVKNLMQTTVAGTVACWWFQPLREYVVRGSLLRATTTSFGSVCFGSLLVAFIHSVRDTLSILRERASRHRNDRDQGRRDSNAALEIVLCLTNELLKCLESVVQYVNKYAFCYIAAYGYGFLEAARKVSALFMDRGWTAVINDNLVSNALTFALFGMAVMNAVVGATLSLVFGISLKAVGIESPMVLLSVLGFLMGFAVGIVLINIVNSAVATVFVCLAENPSVLKDTHPREYHILTSTWLSFHPTLTTWADGYAVPQSLPPPPPAAYEYGYAPPTATASAAFPAFVAGEPVPVYEPTQSYNHSHSSHSRSHDPCHKVAAASTVYSTHNPAHATAGNQPAPYSYQAPTSATATATALGQQHPQQQQQQQPFQMPPSPRGGFGYGGYGGYGGYNPPNGGHSHSGGGPTPPGTNPSYNPW